MMATVNLTAYKKAFQTTVHFQLLWFQHGDALVYKAGSIKTWFDELVWGGTRVACIEP